MSKHRFEYSLAALRRLESWRLDEQSIELADLRDQLKHKANSLGEVEKSIRDLEEHVISLLAHQPTFWLETREITTRFLVELRNEHDRMVEEIVMITARAKGVMAKLIVTQRNERVLDKHHGRQFDIFRRGFKRSEDGVLDDLWLTRFSRAQKSS